MRLRRGRGYLQRSQRLGSGCRSGPPPPTLGSTESQSRGGLVCILPSGWIPRSHLSHAQAHASTKEPPLQGGAPHSLGLSPGLCRPRPHPPSPPLRWRSCWHWTKSRRSPSALLLSGLLSPLCHRQHPISQHPLGGPSWAKAPVLCPQGPGRPACSPPSAFVVVL